MKKLLAVLLSFVMLLCIIPTNAFAAEKTYNSPVSAYAEYDRVKVGANDADYIATMSYDQLAGVLLDWVDREIAKAAADLDSFEVEVLGRNVAVDLDVKSIDDVLAYADYLPQLGGDFANLNTETLSGLTRKNGDINFIYTVLQFMADNADVFGKVFQWEQGKVFDYGKVGEYIETLPEDDSIRTFYNDYLIGNDIQEKFIAEIAREMNYTVPTDENGERTETFDEIISNGIIAWFAGVCEKNGILSAEGIETLKSYDLRTEDIYAHVKNFVALVQSDNQVKIDTYLRFVCDNYIRTALKVMFGFVPTAGETVSDDALVAEFKSAYADTAYLAEISGGSVYYQAADKNYYVVTVAADGTIAEVKSLTWENSMEINFEPPVVGVYTGADETADKVINGYDCDLIKEYRPSEDYIFEIYSPYGDALAGSGVTVAGATAPAIYNDIMVEENATEMRSLVGVNVTGVDPEINTVITFDEIKKLAEEKALEAANQVASNMGATVNSVDITLNYTGYVTDDEFITNVTASAQASLKIMGMTMNQDVSSFMVNPIATVVLDNLSGGLAVDDAFVLMNAVDSDFVVDTSILDFAGNYDEYNGAVGQVNRILCEVLDMLLTDEAYSSLALTEGGNDNLTANIQKVCDKFSGVFEATKAFMDEAGFAEFVKASGVDDLFASSHGFNASMVYNLDFSDVESLYVCLIEMVLDFIDEEEEGTLVNDLHEAVEGLETLDAMAVALTDYALAKVIPSINEKYESKGLVLTVPAATDATTIADGGAKDVIMIKLVDLAYDVAVWAFDDLLNDVVNNAIAKFNEKAGSDIPDVSFKFGVTKQATWEATLTAMVDRIYELADGIIIVCGTYEGTNVFDRISAVVNAILPIGSMFSNCAGNGFVCDLNTILNTYIFDEALEGNFDNFLRLFETAEKTDDVAKDVPVTYALIKASDHIVDAIFPDTVQAENYTASLTVQDEFTSGDSDVQIAANNMRSINLRKTHLVPAALDLIRESGILYYFALCSHEDSMIIDVEAVEAACTTEGKTAGKQCSVCGGIISGCETIAIDENNHKNVQEVAAVEATCVKAGITAGKKCLDCGKVFEGCENIGINANNHKTTSTVSAKAPTCTKNGNTAGVYCNDCKKTVSGNQTIPATGHTYAEWIVVDAPSCESNGTEQRVCACGDSQTRDIPAAGHIDSDGDDVCDVCSKSLKQEDNSFIARLIAFFQRIIDWFKNLFKR